MKAWLLTWNPDNWNWKSTNREKLKLLGKYVERWSCSNTHPEIGDRVFLMRTGDEFRGIIAAGHVARGSYVEPHYDPVKANQGVTANYIDVDFDHIQEDLEDSLPEEDLEALFPEQTWTPMGSGIEIKVDLSKLEQCWGKKIGPKNNILNYLKSLPEIEPEKHDGSYELVLKTIEAYSRMEDRSILDEKDFNVVLYNSVITLRSSVEIKKSHIKNSHLPESEKELLIQFLESLWSNANDFENSKIEGQPTIGMFGIGYMTAKTNAESSQKFIELCIRLLPIDKSSTAFDLTQDCLNQDLRGIQAASASQILHCLKPTIFPIINGGTDGDSDIFSAVGIKLVQRTKANRYVENSRKIESFRNGNLQITNYRVIDLASRTLRVQIDYLGVLNYLETYQNVPYESPDKSSLSVQRKNEILEIKRAGQKATDELKKIADLLCDKFGLIKSGKPIKYLDGSNAKTRNYLWVRLINPPQKSDEAESISIFVDMNGETKKSRFRVALEVENDMVKSNTSLLERHHSFLDSDLMPSDKLFYTSGSNENGSPNVINRSKSEIIESIKLKEYDKVQLCRIIDNSPSLTNEDCAKDILEAVQELLPFYNFIVGRTSEEEWFPKKSEYDPKLSKDQFLTFLGDGTATEKQKSILLFMFKRGGISDSKTLQDAGFGGGSQLEISDFCERLCKNHGVTPHGGEASKYWPVAFYGRKGSSGLYEYKIREELQEALKELGEVMPENKIKTYSLNTILYGPPGTGKTYSTANIAVKICDPENTLSSYDEFKHRFDELKEEKRIEFVTFHQSYDYEDFIEGIKPDLDSGELKYILKPGIFRSFCEEAGKEENKDKNFIFVIDEINRGNISKIFGELITLIETNKRIGEGQKEATTATLPYSHIKFGVPKNVYILGTMNTADRSIALLDTALRRRFAFIEMLPEPEVLIQVGADKVVDGKDILDVVEMLNTINTRIINLYDREHTIGHAFFTKLADNPTVENLAQIFATSVIPLLQEYFYEDYEKIRLVLGDNNKADSNSVFIKKIYVDEAVDFGGTIDFDIPKSRYEINRDAFHNLKSYIAISKKGIK